MSDVIPIYLNPEGDIRMGDPILDIEKQQDETERELLDAAQEICDGIKGKLGRPSYGTERLEEAIRRYREVRP